MLAGERLPLPKLALVASVVAVGWLSARRLAQDVVRAPARMSAQPNLPTSVRATLQFGPIYLATGGRAKQQQGQRCRCKVGWLADTANRRPETDNQGHVSSHFLPAPTISIWREIARRGGGACVGH